MKKETEYISQLDGLRAIAIALVIIFHWYPEGQGINIIANGPLGVTLFFVLSGFLISRILLSSREYLKFNGFVSTYKTFMTRRILRIFPLYYFTLFVIWMAKFVPFIPNVSTQFYERPLYYLLYISNFLIEKLHDWSDVLSPLWSLAVEEQFYIIWPIIILAVKPQHLKSVILATIVLGICSRGLLSYYGYAEGVLMPTCLDAFGLGAFWAVIICNNDSPEKYLKTLGFLFLPAFALFVYFCLNSKVSILETLFFRTAMSVFCLYFVAKASYKNGFKSFFGKILNNSVLKYIGKISYGLYVYHMLVPALVLPVLLKILNRFLHIHFTLSDATWKFVNLILLIAVASVSWYVLEAPINRMKKYFRVNKMHRTANADVAT